jgi:long-chain-alcohol oxidase
VQRRAFLGGMVGGAALLGCRGWVRAPTAVANPHELRTLAAIAETFVPGGDGTPGASDVDAVTTIVDPVHGVAPYIPDVVADLDAWCVVRFHRPFVDLATAEREIALEERMGMRGILIRSWYAPAYEGILALTKLAFFGGITRSAGLAYLAFPGASRGYAPVSAAGAYASTDTPLALAAGATSTIAIAGDGRVSSAHVCAALAGDDARATLRVIAPDGRHRDLPLRAGSALDGIELPLAGGPAAGAWRCEVGAAAGGGRLALWTLRLRTDLDEAAWRT